MQIKVIVVVTKEAPNEITSKTDERLVVSWDQRLAFFLHEICCPSEFLLLVYFFRSLLELSEIISDWDKLKTKQIKILQTCFQP